MRRFWGAVERILYFVIYKLLRITYKETQWEWMCQFAKFIVVGVGNTVVSYVFYLFFWKCGLHYLAANILGYFMGIINSFFWNHKYVFKTEQIRRWELWKTFFKTCCSYLGLGFVMENLLLVFLVQMIRVSESIAPFIAAALIVPINFIVNKLWAYKEK